MGKTKIFAFSARYKKILSTAFRRDRITCNQFSWWDLMELTRRGYLHKVVPGGDTGSGWPHFIISTKGRKLVKQFDLVRPRKNHPRRGPSRNPGSRRE